MSMINEVIYVGVIQTSLDYEAAWVDEKNGTWQDCVRISRLEELRAKREVRHYLASLQGLGRRADIVLLPELAVPIGFERQLKRAAETLEAIIIAGLDYQIEAASARSLSWSRSAAAAGPAGALRASGGPHVGDRRPARAPAQAGGRDIGGDYYRRAGLPDRSC